MDKTLQVVQLAAGAALVLAGGMIWALTGVEAAGSALLAAGATLMPAAAARRRP